MTSTFAQYFALPRPQADVVSQLRGVFATMKQRRDLAKLTATELADIGLTQADVEAEFARPVWNAPVHWKKK